MYLTCYLVTGHLHLLPISYGFNLFGVFYRHMYYLGSFFTHIEHYPRLMMWICQISDSFWDTWFIWVLSLLSFGVFHLRKSPRLSLTSRNRFLYVWTKSEGCPKSILMETPPFTNNLITTYATKLFRFFKCLH